MLYSKTPLELQLVKVYYLHLIENTINLKHATQINPLHFTTLCKQSHAENDDLI